MPAGSGHGGKDIQVLLRLICIYLCLESWYVLSYFYFFLRRYKHLNSIKCFSALWIFIEILCISGCHY